MNHVEGFTLIFTIPISPPTKNKYTTKMWYCLPCSLHRGECINLCCTVQWILKMYPVNQHPEQGIEEHVCHYRKFLRTTFQLPGFFWFLISKINFAYSLHELNTSKTIKSILLGAWLLLINTFWYKYKVWSLEKEK